MNAAGAKIKVVIADDHPLFRDGLRQALVADPEIKLVAETSDGKAALAAIKTHSPDVAVLDIGMPLLNGFGVARAVQEKKLNVAIVFLTMYNQEDMFNQALNAGVLGYILKDSAVNDILLAVKSVAAGRHYLSPVISHFLARRISGRDRLQTHVPGLADLTPAELRVLKLVAEDRSSKEIAEFLEISVRTVESHRANICEKLNLHGSHKLLRFAFDHRNEL